MQLLFVINPISGDKNKDTLKQELTKFTKENGHTCEFFITTGQNDQDQLQAIIKKNPPDIIAVAGGDGTLQMIAKTLMHKKIPIAIIPAGSANGMATELKIPQGTKAALDLIIKKNISTIDVLKINEKHYCLHLSDIGFNARTVKQFEKDPKRGFRTYAKYFFKELKKSRTFKLSIWTQKGWYTTNIYMAVIANAKSYGTGFTINPSGKNNDGQFEIILFKRFKVYHIFFMVYYFITGKSHKLNRIKVFKSEKAQIKNPEKQPLQVDGEIMGQPELLTVEIIPQSVQFIVP